MSQIISKAFDASKKIIRSIFKGSPNLFTSSDLNRQIEAIKYQLDLLDDKTGFVSDMDLNSASLSSDGILSVTPIFTALKYKGCDFKPASRLLQRDISSKPAYLALFAKTSEVTYEIDSSHEIAGAKFADGTSQPAANQLIYVDEKFGLIYADYAPNEEVDGVLIGVIAKFQQTSQGSLIIKRNYFTGVTDVLSFRTENNVINSDADSIGQITPGMPYDQAINTLQNRLNDLKNPLQTSWINLLRKDSPTEDAQCKITNGVMYLRFRQHEIEVTTSRNGHHTFGVFASFPPALNSTLSQYFNALGIANLEISPYGSFGTCYMVNGTTTVASPYKYEGNILEIWTLCLVLRGDMIAGGDDLTSSIAVNTVGVGMMQSMEVSLIDGKVREIDYRNVSEGVGMDGMLVVPEMTVAIPLPGIKW